MAGLRLLDELLDKVRFQTHSRLMSCEEISYLTPRLEVATHPFRCPFRHKICRPHDKKYYYVPCGRCLYCRERQASGWYSRQLAEASASSQVFFVTLTYADRFKEPINKDVLQRFFKRLRKAGLVFRYIALAEYGPKTLRPHYHVLFFLHDIREFQCPTHFGNYLSDFWRVGHVHVKTPTSNHHKYIAKYSKDLFMDTPSFKLYSLRPGIGKDSEYYLAMLDHWADTGEYSIETADGTLSIPYSCILDARKRYGLDTPPPELVDYDVTREDIQRYMYDLQQAYESFCRRKL